MTTLLEEARATLLKRREVLLKLYRVSPTRRHHAVDVEPDVLDQAANDEDGARNARLADAEFAEIRTIDDALARMRTDAWGWCVDCGAAIEPRRLLAMPEATRCVGCSEVAQGGRA